MDQELQIRLANLKDVERIFHLSNDPVVRACSIQNKPITWDSHKVWFQNAITNPCHRFYVVENSGGEFVAQVRFKLQGTQWITSISIHSDFRAKGLGVKILNLALTQMPQQNFLAYVKKQNVPSLCIFYKAGFICNGEAFIKNELYKVFSYES